MRVLQEKYESLVRKVLMFIFCQTSAYITTTVKFYILVILYFASAHSASISKTNVMMKLVTLTYGI